MKCNKKLILGFIGALVHQSGFAQDSNRFELKQIRKSRAYGTYPASEAKLYFEKISLTQWALVREPFPGTDEPPEPCIN